MTLAPVFVHINPLCFWMLDGQNPGQSMLVISWWPGSHYWAPHFWTWPTPEYTSCNEFSASLRWRPRPERLSLFLKAPTSCSAAGQSSQLRQQVEAIRGRRPRLKCIFLPRGWADLQKYRLINHLQWNCIHYIHAIIYLYMNLLM